ncbi:MAG: NUDIX hydrolase [Candidatus Magasanikbacteria bacterium CG10_big_fil_rev_8_21_14_0_10_36_32]|uniref:NUDIX hydrolase n=1 Tax=Candidatus Magasanikbacteria bacterium CG10_big_fil_rev_8_21_14_0_10_36_32 TaxID=1974646 RepID=A0A2M6W5R5_9BACT|nr:MAG: NUDIX hydrolase [Candidatus Magasanikbacteria bacterium CG10_big_fil_rev_8_21_14_0_10_36_32]
MNVVDAISILEERVPNPSEGLPDEIFFYISKTTPLVNIDLLIKDENGRTLLSWRNDKNSGQGWHVPGGIIRFKETLEERVNKVAEIEIGQKIDFNPVPIAVNQFINRERSIRSHFVSILYKGFLSSDFIPENRGFTKDDAGYLKWHDFCPDNMIKCQKIYQKYID